MNTVAFVGFLLIAISAVVWIGSALWAVVDVTKSPELSRNDRLAWSFAAVLLPFAGAVVWLIFRSVSLRPDPA